MIRLLPAALALGCAPQTPWLEDGWFHTVDVELVADSAAATAALAETCDLANETLQVALPRLEDLALADAIVAASDRGVEVAVVMDTDTRSGAGVDVLRDADIPITWTDGELEYFDFNLNEDVAWTSEQTIMSHAFVVADRYHATLATRAGDEAVASASCCTPRARTSPRTCGASSTSCPAVSTPPPPPPSTGWPSPSPTPAGPTRPTAT